MKWSDLPTPVRNAIERYAKARVALSWKGSKDPESFAQIDQEVVDAKQRLLSALSTYAVDMVPVE